MVSLSQFGMAMLQRCGAWQPIHVSMLLFDFLCAHIVNSVSTVVFSIRRWHACVNARYVVSMCTCQDLYCDLVLGAIAPLLRLSKNCIGISWLLPPDSDSQMKCKLMVRMLDLTGWVQSLAELAEFETISMFDLTRPAGEMPPAGFIPGW